MTQGQLQEHDFQHHSHRHARSPHPLTPHAHMIIPPFIVILFVHTKVPEVTTLQRLSAKPKVRVNCWSVKKLMA